MTVHSSHLARQGRSCLKNLQAVVLDEVDLLQPPGSFDGLEPPTRAPTGKRTARGKNGQAGRPVPSRGTLRQRGARPGPMREYRGSENARRSPSTLNPIERRLGQRRPTQVLIEWLMRGRPRSAPALQVISCSATICPQVRRGIGLLVGGKGKHDAGAVVTAEPAHPAPASLKRRGVGAVTLPSTLSHTAYVGREAAKLLMLQVATEEMMPSAPLLVIPNGRSLLKQVTELHKAGFSRAVALPEALGVPMVDTVAALAVNDTLDHGDGTVGMLRNRQQLADRFSERNKADLPLLVTTEYAARGLDFKNIDCVFLLGLPQRIDSYVHVAGRTAREGRRGRAVSLVFTEEERLRLDEFRRELGFKVQVVDLSFLRP